MAKYNGPITEGQSLAMNYTGTVDVVTIQKSGLYELKVTGGDGGASWKGSNQGGNRAGGKGGTSVGYKYLKKGEKIYVCIGGGGSNSDRSANGAHSGGYNGGGDGAGDGTAGGSGGGGGATHMALVSGTLKQIGVANLSQVLIVAGGGAGAYAGVDYPPTTTGGTGGAGGGLSGAAGPGGGGAGGTQNGAGTGGGFGYGGAKTGVNAAYYGPGGGGLYGGGYQSSYYYGGGGGSGYIGGVPAITYKGTRYNPSTSVGSGNGQGAHGTASIKLVKKGSPTMYLGDKEVDALYYGDFEVNTSYYGDQEAG